MRYLTLLPFLALLFEACGSDPGTPPEGAVELVGDSLIQIYSPEPGALITSPLKVGGVARGVYYFEGDFPVRLEDNDGNELALTPAKAASNWMTEDWVEYSATLEFAAPATEAGFLILERDNPSGLEGNAHRLKLPVRFR